MLLKSKVDDGVIRRSTYFTYDCQVDHENSHLDDDSKDDCVNVFDERNSSIVKIPNDKSDDLYSKCAK